MATLVLALDRRTEDRLIGDIVEHGHVVLARLATTREVLAALDVTPPDVIVIGATPALLTPELLAACDACGVRVVALAESDSDHRYALSLGLHEVVDGQASWAEIETMLADGIAVPLRVGDDAPRQPGALDAGSVIAVWGPAGSPGRTTLAINIAAEIAAAGHTVALCDVDTYSGSVAPSLGMLDEAPGFAAACRLAGADSLTQAELERVAQRYNSPHGAFWVLTGIGRPARWPELSASRVSAVVRAVRHWVDYVVLDTGFSLEADEEISSDLFSPRRNAATLTALREADHVVACGLADPVGMSRFLRAWGDLADIVTTERVTVVMNRVRSSAIGMNPNGQVQSTLRRFGNISSVVLVPLDLPATDAAVLAGRTLRDTAPKSAVRGRIRLLVNTELVPKPPAVRSAGRRRAVPGLHARRATG
jgi:MinD-like ATPase involved in chromosome partitioning or flagellar assembly